ncbi:MAG: purE [Candidatus Kaiserbacteria bacterium]|nr:purE [Candidatus Kaiserbacteria bacterium]
MPKKSVQKDVLILMGSETDADTVDFACAVLDVLKITYDQRITSAHRTPWRLAYAASRAKKQGFKVILGFAGGSAHLPGMAASYTPLPAFAVAVLSKTSVINDFCAVFSSIGMPKGAPLNFCGYGQAGAENAALMAALVLALSDKVLAARVDAHRLKQARSVRRKPRPKGKRS